MIRFYRIHLKARDVIETARWYVDNIGAKQIKDYRDRGNHHILLDVAGIEIIITQPPDAERLPQPPLSAYIGLEHFGVSTKDLDGLLSDLQDKGVDLISRTSPDSENQYAFVRAPDGVRLEIVED